MIKLLNSSRTHAAIIFAQFNSGPYSGSAYGDSESAPNTGFMPGLLPDDVIGWLLLAGGILAISISLWLFFKKSKKNNQK